MTLGPVVTVKVIMVAEMTPKCPMTYMSHLVPPFQQPTKKMCVITPTGQTSD